MPENDSGLSIELRLPFLSIRANNVRTRLWPRLRSAGPFMIIARSNGLALEAPTDTGGGSHPATARPSGKTQQLWHFSPTGEARHVRITSAISGLVLDAGQSSDWNYSPELWPWQGKRWQIWSATPSPDGRAQFLRSYENGLVLDCPKDDEGTWPTIHGSHGRENQQWIIALPVSALNGGRRNLW